MVHFLWNCPVYSERRALFLEHLKNNLGNEFEHFKSCNIAGKSHFILGTELWGSRYEELLRLVKSYIIDIWELRKSKLYGSGTGPLQYRSRPGRDTTCQGKGKFGKLGGRSHALLFMVPLGLPSARPMAQALQLPFEYYIYYNYAYMQVYYNIIITCIYASIYNIILLYAYMQV